MATMWAQVVAVIQWALTTAAACAGGSAGVAIVIVSLSLRLALLPLTLRMARQAEAQRLLLEKLRPQLDALQRLFAKEPARLAEHTMTLYRTHGVRPLSGGALAALLMQLPLASALYGALHAGFGAGQAFLWIADLARPDLALVALTGALTYVTSHFGPPQSAKPVAGAIGAVLTMVVMWRVSAALGLYWASSTAVGAAQAAWVRYRRAPLAAHPR